MNQPSPPAGMSVRTATRLEYAIIGLGLVALLLIFQPFSLGLFSVGCVLVVAAGLINNLLPMAEPGVSLRSVLVMLLVVAMIFLIVLLVSVASAHLYGAYFLPQATTAPTAKPFYQQPFIWSVAAITAILAGLVSALSRRARG
jgi:hypothetical protein